MIECKLCNKSFKNIQRLSTHLTNTHKNISKEEYYNTYILPFNEQLNSGTCIICGKPTKFIRFKYNKYCSADCERHDGSARNAQKAVQTKRDTGVYTRLNRELAKRMKADGTYDIIHEKAWKTIRSTGKDKTMYIKAVETARKNGSYESGSIKRTQTLKKNNHNFNSSKAEIRCKELLISIYGENNIEHNYLDELDYYPFPCDLYIKSLNLFIECNFHWTHGGHYFNENNPEDIAKLNIWKEKAKASYYYKIAIDTWTKRDLNKLHTAKINNINYLVFWTEQDFINYFMEGCN